MVIKIESRPAWAAPQAAPAKPTIRRALKPSRDQTPSRITLRTAKPKPTEPSKSATTVRLAVANPTTERLRKYTTKEHNALFNSRRVLTPVTIKHPNTLSPRTRRVLTPVEIRHPNTLSPRTRRVLTSISTGHSNIPRQTKSLSKDAEGEQGDELEGEALSKNASDETLEERIRSALSAPLTIHKTNTSGSVKSVRWDPAIVSCGPSSPVPSPSSKVEDSNLSLSRPQPVLLPPDHRDTTEDLIKSLAHMKKREKHTLDTLRKFLEKLKETERANELTDESNSTEEDSRTASDCNLAPVAQATTNRRYATLKAQMAQQKARANLGRATLTVPRRRPHVEAGNASPQRNPQEPTWVNIFNPPPHLALPRDVPAFPGSAPNILHPDFRQLPPGYPPGLQLPPESSNNFWNEGITDRQMPLPNGLPHGPFADPVHPMDPPQTEWSPMPIPPSCGMENLPQFGYWVNPFGFQTPQPPFQAPPEWAPTRAPPTISRRQFKPKVNQGPLIDVGPEFLPSEEEPGREARAIEPGWAKSLLAKFQEKYPRTGRVKAGPLVPGKMREAAAIQQRLEFILYHEKERNAEQRSSGEQFPCYEAVMGEKIALSDNDRPVKGKENVLSEYSGEEWVEFVRDEERKPLAQYARDIQQENPKNGLDNLADSFSTSDLDDGCAVVWA